MKAYIKRSDKNKKFFAEIIARNGRMVWMTPPQYEQKRSAKNAVAMLKLKNVNVIDATL